MGINYKWSQGQIERAVALWEEEEDIFDKHSGMTNIKNKHQTKGNEQLSFLKL